MRANQAGSIVSFVIIGLLLALGAVGLFYYIGHQSGTTPTNQPGTSAPAPDTPEKDKKVEKKPAPAQNNQSEGTESTATAPTPEELSHTGPAETAMTLLALGVLTATSVAYVRSRRRTASL